MSGIIYMQLAIRLKKEKAFTVIAAIQPVKFLDKVLGYGTRILNRSIFPICLRNIEQNSTS